jgi:hypothetical protein
LNETILIIFSISKHLESFAAHLANLAAHQLRITVVDQLELYSRMRSAWFDSSSISYIVVRKHRESSLSLDWPAKNLISHACPLLAAELLLSNPMLVGLCRQLCVFSCFVVLGIRASTISSVVKQCSEIKYRV